MADEARPQPLLRAPKTNNGNTVMYGLPTQNTRSGVIKLASILSSTLSPRQVRVGWLTAAKLYYLKDAKTTCKWIWVISEG